LNEKLEKKKNNKMKKERQFHLISLMALAQQMRIEFVDILHLFAANVALPWIGFAVAALVQEVERLIRKFDAAKQTLQMSLLAAQYQLGFVACRRDDAVGCRGYDGRRRLLAGRLVVIVVVVVVIVVVRRRQATSSGGSARSIVSASRIAVFTVTA
jgi:hypothetical protein